MVDGVRLVPIGGSERINRYIDLVPCVSPVPAVQINGDDHGDIS